MEGGLSFCHFSLVVLDASSLHLISFRKTNFGNLSSPFFSSVYSDEKSLVFSGGFLMVILRVLVEDPFREE